MSASSASPAAVLPAGTWRVEPGSGEVGFRARGMWGLAPVKGRFDGYDGELVVDDGGVRGELRLEAATLNTRNAKRDTHLRSEDFFDAERHPTVTFVLTGLTPGSGNQAQATGTLRIRDNSLDISSPVTVERHDDHLHLSAKLSVDRQAAGVGWSNRGIIRGPAQLHADVILVREG